MKLSEKLVELRKGKRLSQLELAEMMNVSRQAVSRWEVGASIPSTENLKFLSQLYGVSIEYLLSEDGECDITISEKASTTENITRSEDGHKKRNGTIRAIVIMIAIAMVVFIAVVCLRFFDKQDESIIKIGTSEGSEIETDREIDFEIGW